MKTPIYFDNAATTPVHPKVFEKMKPFLEEEYGNPSSIHSFGRKARIAIEEARETIADFIGANPSEIYFTSGGTEANNFLIRGIVNAEFAESCRDEIITSDAEHHAVLDTYEELDKLKISKSIDLASSEKLRKVESANLPRFFFNPTVQAVTIPPINHKATTLIIMYRKIFIKFRIAVFNFPIIIILTIFYLIKQL